MFKGVKNRILSSTSRKERNNDKEKEGTPSSPRSNSDKATIDNLSSSFSSSLDISPPSTPNSPGIDFNGKKVTAEDFELLMVIGRGTFGKVMQVKKKDTGEIYAMKVIKKEFVIQHEQIIHTKAEKSIMQRVNHPFIVALKYAFQTGDKLYMILDYVNGGELFFHLRNSGTFPEARVKLYIAEIALAIDYLHENGIMYRDLKPENVLVDNDGHVRLTDFGLSKELERRDIKHRQSFAVFQGISTNTNDSNNNNNNNNNNSNNNGSKRSDSESTSDRAHTFCGTPDYLAPEILMSTPSGKDGDAVGYGKEVDWWAVGILMYEMLVGEPPFFNENTNLMYKSIIKDEVRFPTNVVISNNAKSLIQGLLHKVASHRIDGAKLIAHPFFQGMDWQDVYEKRITPLWKPSVQHETDASQVPDEFRDEFPVDSVVDSSNMPATMKKQAINEFIGFTYNGDNTMTGNQQKQSQRYKNIGDESADGPIEGYLT